MNPENVNFVMKYGSSEHIDSIIHSEIPHWNDLHPKTKKSMFTACITAAANPNLTDRQISKMIKLPHYNVELIHYSLLQNKSLAGHHIEEIAHASAHSYGVVNAICKHPNVTHAAMDHIIEFERNDDNTSKEEKAHNIASFRAVKARIK